MPTLKLATTSVSSILIKVWKRKKGVLALVDHEAAY